jgi:hypothetical protein
MIITINTGTRLNSKYIPNSASGADGPVIRIIDAINIVMIAKIPAIKKRVQF